MMLYILIIWTLANNNSLPIKVAVYEHQAICEEAAEVWRQPVPSWYRAKCLPVESRSAVVESQR